MQISTVDVVDQQTVPEQYEGGTGGNVSVGESWVRLLKPAFSYCLKGALSDKNMQCYIS